MRPTRRGWAALAIAVAAVVLAGAHGPRALNAVAGPLFGAVAFGAVQVWRAAEPDVDPQPVEPGFPGAERTFRVDLGGEGVIRVQHDWPAGLEGDGLDVVVAGADGVETDVVLRDRGRYEVDGPAVERRDALGLVRSGVESAASTTIVVYPAIHRGPGGDVIGGIIGVDVPAERQEFDRLREYVPGDPLRDIHWKSSAKGQDLVVAEYEPSDRTASVTIAATADSGAADAMATAAGTMAVRAIEAGYAVGLSLPGRAIPPGAGRDHELTLLRALAAADHGSADGDAADVRIHATATETRITVGDTDHRFADLIDAPAPTPEGEVVRA